MASKRAGIVAIGGEAELVAQVADPSRMTTTDIARDNALKTGMKDGMEQGYPRLDELLASQSAM